MKYDTNTNAFVWQTSQPTRGRYYDTGPSRTIVSEDGRRVFWVGTVHDQDLNALWTMDDSIQCVSADGRYAFSQSMVYDVVLKKALQPMPVTTAVSAHNSVSGNLVVQNGASLGFFRFAGQTTPGVGTSPLAGSLTEPPSELLWPGITGASGYRVYLGTSATSVGEASADSDEYLGETTTGSIAIPSSLSVGQTYYWRVDVIMGGKIAKGDVVAFATAPFSTTVTSISTSTVQSHATHTATIDLASTVPGQSWTATSPAAWIGFKRDNGVTPASIKVVMDASQLTVGVHQSTVSVSWSGGSLTIPVSLMVDPLAVTAIRSRADSTRLYALSEVQTYGSDGGPRAYLLEIDSLQKCITRTTRVGRNATSLAVHDADNRVYVTNKKSSYIHAVDLDTFELVRTYPLQNTYKLSAGAAGRLIYVPENSPMVYLLNTTTGEVMSSLSVGEGNGAFEPTGRYYFQGASTSSPFSMRKLDVSSGTLVQISSATVTEPGVPGYYRPLVMAESGQRMFWNGMVQDQDLAVEWLLPENIYSVSGDGRYAFSETKIYDIAQKKLLKAMPVTTTISAFNTATGRLVVQKGAALDFSSPVGPGLLGDELFPANLQVVEPPEQLRWKAIPGALAYRVYLGASAEAVEEATPDSDEYLGEVTDPAINLAPVPPAGQSRYWRVDVVILDDQVAKGELLTFFASTITPNISVIDAVTVQGHVDYSVAVALSSETSGKTWTASSSESWIHIETSAGSTPATLDISLDASRLDEGSYRGSVVVTTAEGSFPITVQLQVEAPSIRILKSAPNSYKVYAISEKTYDVAPIAYLLEIDTELSCITRVLPVGTGVTDLAIHPADGRIYVTNPRMGTLSAISIDDFLEKRIYEVPRNTTSSRDDIYRMSPGLPGRLIVSSERNTGPGLFDTASGTVITRLIEPSSARGASDPTGRYYYDPISHGHGTYAIRKTDTQEDALSQVLLQPVTAGHVGILISGNGRRIFQGATAFSSDLVGEGSTGTWVYATTYDGGLFFSNSSVQEFPSLNVVLSLPTITSSFYAYNDTTQTLVLLVGNRLGCYALKAGSALPKPMLSADNITHGSVRLTWDNRALESGCVLEQRRLGSVEWTIVREPMAGYTITATATDLRPGTTYEFRVKAVSPVATSTWSDILTVTTPEGPPFFEMPADTVVAGGAPLILPITASGSGNVYTVSGLPPGMSFDATNGAITGSSQTIGHHSVIVTGTNSFGTRSQTFVITIGSTTQNNASARYAGLVSGNTLLTGSWTLDRTGNAFSGSYNCSGGIFKFKGAFPAAGEVREVEISGRLSGVDLEITATWDRVIDRVTLDVYAFGDGVDTFEDTGFASTWNSKGRPYPKSGLFNALMLPASDSTADEPEGYGFLSLNFANTGAVQILGETALGNKITWAGPVLDNYNLPLYWKSGDSILWGIISTSPNEVGAPPVFGSLGWVAVFNPSRKAYTYGFGQGLDVVGSRFTAGKAATDLFKTSNTQVLQLGAGGMDRMMETLVQPFGIAGKKVVLPTSNPYQMKLTLTPKTGLVTGTVVVTDPHPSGGAPVKRTVTFRGVMIRKTHPEGRDAVGGYFLMPGWNGQVRSGWMEITAPTP
ncbi:MAG TPA: putative Ig domain-containing protein [Roseimicrobium sp.]|nr:putative Ig domain-containing protein [Roseimicrobium sp.]